MQKNLLMKNALASLQVFLPYLPFYFLPGIIRINIFCCRATQKRNRYYEKYWALHV